jgi:transcription elongation factor GreA-like protein/transcription elongation GreA/GreB family factor
MAYVEEFRNRLASREYNKVIELWHEYCEGAESADGQEIVDILNVFKQSEFAKTFGQYVETILPLILTIQEETAKLNALKALFDLQTTNNENLYQLALDVLKNHFPNDPAFNEKLRLVGMRSRENFQGVLSNYFLLNHIQKGNFVLHTAGWGVGEIMDFSTLREQATIEFENPQGSKRDISFKNAFKTLLPIAKTHFLARRFDDPDTLEAEARNAPVEIIRTILKDLGPKTASEIKELLSDIVIPEEEYSKWWQQARTKLKKDARIECPENPKMPFYERKGEASFDDRFQKAFKGKLSAQDTITASHNLTRDFPEVLKDQKIKELIVSKIQAVLAQNPANSELIQALLFLESPLGAQEKHEMLKSATLKMSAREVEDTIQKIEIIALKKRWLSLIRTLRNDWAEIYLHLLFAIDPNQLKDFIIKELPTDVVEKKLQELVLQPKSHPEAVVWYFQKIVGQKSSGEEAEFFTSQEGKAHFFEAFLTLFNSLDSKAEYRDLSKKMYNLLTGNRFEVVRNFLKEAPADFVQEFLLLASKCLAFSDHEQKILRSLAEVAHPTIVIKQQKAPSTQDLHVIWTTQEGYNRTHERIKQIGTVEMVENAKEIETARAHGDLRENAEFKAAQERRARLQSELKMLSDQFRHARLITREDIRYDSIGIGSIVDVVNTKDQKTTYTVLGPWDADPDKSILSIQSKFVQSMLGKKVGESFAFKDDTFTVVSIKSYLEN